MTRTISRRALAASSAALAVSVVAAGCGSSDDTGSTAGSTGGSSAGGAGAGITVQTSQFSWTAATLTNDIIETVVEQNPDLGVAGLETTQLDPAAAWAGAKNGDIDLLTEVALPNQQTFLDDTPDVDMLHETYTGANQGWFVPTYATQPGQPLEGLTSVTQLNDYADALDRTLYDADPGWVTTQQNQSRLDGYQIDFEHSTSSATALFAQLQRSYDAQEPIVLYLYRPLWVFAQFDMTQLDEPNPYTEGCLDEGGPGNCAMPDYSAGIAASQDLQEQVPAFTDMLSQLDIPLDDMEQMIYDVDVDEQDAAEVAQQWVTDNPDVVGS